MAYPTEHSARLREPEEFKSDTYKRVDGGKLFGRVTVPKTIAILSAKLKGKDKPSDPYIAQSLRFPVKSWTASEAKAWLKKNKVDFILFEAATKSKDKQSADQNTASRQACIFGQGCEVSFAEAGVEQKEANQFRIIAYSGKVIPGHWLWGNTAFDLTGLKFDKKKTGVLENHFSDKRIGFTTKQEVSDKVLVEGKFLSNPTAQQIKGDIADGFPMQASMYIPPQLIEHIKEGESVEVNGQKLKGPGTVFRKAIIKEVSMCALGADSHTQSKTFAEGGEQEIQFNVLEKEQVMQTESTVALPAETFADEQGNQQNQSEAAFEDKDSSSSKFWDAVERQVKKMNCSRADAIRFIVREHPKMHKEFLQKLKAPSKPEFTEFFARVKKYREETGCNEGDAIRACFAQYPELVSFCDAVDRQVKKMNCSRADAVRFIVAEHPQLHEAFLQDQLEAAKARDVTSESGRPPAEHVAGQPATWEAAIKQQMKADASNSSEISKRAIAIRFCVREYPELHRKMLEEQRRG